jgi:hypothetical protein
MMEGTASSWADMFYQVCEGRMAKYGSWTDFEKEFRDMFLPANASIVTLNNIQKLKQLMKSLTSYIAEFHSLVAVANIKESHILIHMFNLGLNDNLLHAIHMMGEIPIDFDKYVTAVIKIDNNINCRNTTISLTNANCYCNYLPQYKPQKKENDAMDMDHLDEEECAECMATGLCFLCQKCGHHANRCPDKKKKVPVRQEKIEEEDEVENHHLAEDF